MKCKFHYTSVCAFCVLYIYVSLLSTVKILISQFFYTYSFNAIINLRHVKNKKLANVAIVHMFATLYIGFVLALQLLSTRYGLTMIVQRCNGHSVDTIKAKVNGVIDFGLEDEQSITPHIQSSSFPHKSTLGEEFLHCMNW